MNGFPNVILESLAITSLDHIVGAAEDFLATDNIRTLALNDFSVFVRQNGLDTNYKPVSTMLAAVRHYYDTGDASRMRPAFGPFIAFAAPHHAHRVARIALGEKEQKISETASQNGARGRPRSRKLTDETMAATIADVYPDGEFSFDGKPKPRGHIDLLHYKLQVLGVDVSRSTVENAIKRLEKASRKVTGTSSS